MGGGGALLPSHTPIVCTVDDAATAYVCGAAGVGGGVVQDLETFGTTTRPTTATGSALAFLRRAESGGRATSRAGLSPVPSPKPQVVSAADLRLMVCGEEEVVLSDAVHAQLFRALWDCARSALEASMADRGSKVPHAQVWHGAAAFLTGCEVD